MLYRMIIPLYIFLFSKSVRISNFNSGGVMAFRFLGLLKNSQTVGKSAGIKQVVSSTLIFILCEQFNSSKVLGEVIFVQWANI